MELAENYEKLLEWQRICHRSANWVVTHQYIQSEIQRIHYITDEEKIKLSNVDTDKDGILTTSPQNTTYQVLSRAFKGEAPMGMLSSLNSVVSSMVKQELDEVRTGKRSLRTYKNNLPMPFQAKSIKDWTKLDNGNYSFTLFGMPFRTNFGRDLSGNENLIDSMIEKKYKLCDSSIQLRKGKIFLLAVLRIPHVPLLLDVEKLCEAQLSKDYPIVANIGEKTLTIGNAEEYQHRRTEIQRSVQRLKTSMHYNSGGKGKLKKQAALTRLQIKEMNYINTKMHKYSALLVRYCVDNKCGKLVLKKQRENQTSNAMVYDTEAHFLIRNWAYFRLKEKISYKCHKFGIELIVE